MPINLLELKNIEAFKNSDKGMLADHVVTPEEVRHLFELCDSLWLHSGDPKNPHAELISGKCSNGYVDCGRTLRFTYVCQFLADQLVKKLRGVYTGPIDWVVGSDHAGAAPSHCVALNLETKHEFTEKSEDKKGQIWKRYVIEPEERVLQVEDLITTTQTVKAAREGMRTGNPNPITFIPFVMTLIHRSSVFEFEESPILYLAHFDIEVWEPAECPLCALGSKRLRPKTHWKELTSK